MFYFFIFVLLIVDAIAKSSPINPLWKQKKRRNNYTLNRYVCNGTTCPGWNIDTIACGHSNHLLTTQQTKQ